MDDAQESGNAWRDTEEKRDDRDWVKPAVVPIWTLLLLKAGKIKLTAAEDEIIDN
jgi:hypothetical protein